MAVLRVERDDRVVRLVVPEPVLPARADRLAWEIEDACRAVAESDELAVCVVLAGAGDSFLLAPAAGPLEWDDAGAAAAAIAGSLARLDPPTLAVLGGDAVGPAWEIALACDLRLAAEGVRVGSPELAHGRMPAAGATQRLPRLVGLGTALRLLLLAEVVPAAEARELGLVHDAVPAAGLDAAADALLDALRATAPIALAYVKEAVGQALDLPLEAGLRLEADLAALLQTTSDRAEGLRAHRERRPPRFEGR